MLLWNLIQLFESLSVLFILATVFQNVDDVQEILVADQRKVGGWLLRLEVVGDEVSSECLYSQDFIFEIGWIFELLITVFYNLEQVSFVNADEKWHESFFLEANV